MLKNVLFILVTDDQALKLHFNKQSYIELKSTIHLVEGFKFKSPIRGYQFLNQRKYDQTFAQEDCANVLKT